MGTGKSTIIPFGFRLLAPSSGKVERQHSLHVLAMYLKKLYLDPTMPLTVKRFITLKPGVKDKDILPALERVNAAKINKRPLCKKLSGVNHNACYSPELFT